MRRVSVSSDALSVRGDSKLAMCCRKKVSDALSVRTLDTLTQFVVDVGR